MTTIDQQLHDAGITPRDQWTVADKLRAMGEAGFDVTAEVRRLDVMEAAGTPIFVAIVKVTVEDGETLMTTENVGSCPFASTRWELSEEFAPDAAVTRAIGRCLTTLAPLTFGTIHMGNADEVAQAVEAVIDAIMTAPDAVALKRVRDKAQQLAQVATAEQKAAIIKAWQDKAVEFSNKKQQS